MRSKKYTIITKVGNNDFKKWNCNDLLSFTRFLDKSHPNWRWFNVYDKKTKEQIGNYTNRNRPSTKFI